jgi:predicted Rossmann fold flavoprotein
MSKPRVVAIGGGPAGMLAAGRAAECGADVALLEKGPKLGRKLRICGKGRGNITNTADLNEFIEAFAPNGKFLYGAFSRFFRDDLLDLLRRFDVETKVERGGRVFPESDKAGDVADALERWIASSGVRIKTNFTAKSIAVVDGKVAGIEVHGGRMSADAVVIATGGASYPKTGSTGDGYAMAREAGHTIISPEPALSAMVTKEDWVKDLQGLSLKNVEASLLVERASGAAPAKIASEFGEMLFTHFGVSGPIILTLSRAARSYLKSGSVIVSIDLKPALSEEQLHAKLIREFAQSKHFANYLHGLLPRLLADLFAYLTRIDPTKPVNSITSEERARIVGLLKDLRVTATRLGSLEEAIVTAGGVPISEIDPKTMMSKLVDGLFFAGEVIDVDAETGGFNLQAAFSTGYVAGEAAAHFASGRI